MTTHVVRVFFGFSPLGAYALEPKSMTTPIRFMPFLDFVVPQSEEKFGLTLGAIDGMSSLLNTNDHPSTAPSLISTVGPVIAAVHVFAFGAAWKYPQYRQPFSAAVAEVALTKCVESRAARSAKSRVDFLADFCEKVLMYWSLLCQRVSQG